MISDHISFQEATRTSTGLLNAPDDTQIASMRALAVNVFEPLRKAIGEAILVNSFFRSAEVNRKIGGGANSQHVKGEAIDISKPGQNAEMFNYIRKHLPFDQLIWEYGNDEEPAWVHVSYKATGNRKEALRAKKVNGKTNGKTIYLKYA